MRAALPSARSALKVGTDRPSAYIFQPKFGYDASARGEARRRARWGSDGCLSSWQFRLTSIGFEKGRNLCRRFGRIIDAGVVT